MAAKKAPKEAQVDRSVNGSRGSAEPTADGGPIVPAPPTQLADAEQRAAHNTSDELQRTRLRAEIVGRFLRELTKCVTSRDGTLRVLGVITWVFLLVLIASLAVVLFVLAFRWDPGTAFLLLTGSTSLVALINRILRRRK
jgi:hypothetical protein